MSTPILKFGTDENATIGIIQSESRNESVEVSEARDASGKIIEQRGYSKTEERQFEALLDASVTLPAIGTEITITDGSEGAVEWKAIITSLQKTFSNSDYAKISLTAQKKDNASVVAYVPAAVEG